MNLQTLISTFGPGPLVCIVLVGLALCFACRTKPWIVLIWIPVTGGLLCGVGKVIRELTSVSGVQGPDAGFAGMAAMFLLPVLGILLLGLIACICCIPRREAWRRSIAIPALLIYSLLFLASDWLNASSVEIALFDATGRSLPGVRIEYQLIEGGLSRQRRILGTDPSGKVRFELRQGQNAELSIMPRPRSPHEIDTSPTFWTLRISPSEKSRGQLVIRHIWQRSVASQTLNESFTEVIPHSHRIQLPLTLPNHGSLDPAPRQERIRAAFAAFEQSHPPDLTYAYLCRNVEAIEFIPRLIEVYRSKGAGSENVVEGLAQIAGILSELERGCRDLQRKVKSEPYYPRQMLRNQIDQFCIWAGIPEDERTDATRELEKVEEKIAAHAMLLMDFALEELPRDPGASKIPSELRWLARPHLPRVLAILLENPPTDLRSISQWRHSLFMMRARFIDLQPLWASENPLLVIVACEATPDEQLKNGIAAQALARLEATLPGIADPIAAQRAQSLIKMLRERLN